MRDGVICIACDAGEEEDIVSHENGRGVYLKERNVVICPMEKLCTQFAIKRMKNTAFSKKHDVENLHIKQIRLKPDSEVICKRKEIVEHPFGTIKRGMFAEHVLTKGFKKCNW